MALGHQYRSSFGGHIGDQIQQGSAIVRTRDEALGAHSGVGAGDDAIALRELLSGYSTLREGAPLSSYLYRKKVSL